MADLGEGTGGVRPATPILVKTRKVQTAKTIFVPWKGTLTLTLSVDWPLRDSVG